MAYAISPKPSPVRQSPKEMVQHPAPRLPLVEDLARNIGGLQPSVRAVIGLQHLLGSTVSLIDALTHDVVSPSNVFLLGKPYSTSPAVHRFLSRQRGYFVHPDSTRQAESVDNDSEMDGRIQALLEEVERRLPSDAYGPDGRVVLIDDGARAIRMLHRDRWRHLRARMTCVEQTRCGIRNLEGVDLEVPVINVAESWGKLEHESPMIAESVIHELERQLWALSSSGVRTGRALSVIGYGAIGGAVARRFRQRGYWVRVHDRCPERRRVAETDGFSVVSSLPALLGAGGVIVGCTGLPTVEPADYAAIAHDAILVSASSSDVEFTSWHMRRAATCLGDPRQWRHGGRGRLDADAHHPCFSLYRVHQGGKGFYLVNGGFPVNFTGEIDPIAPSRIQLTRGLLYLGAVQASRTWAPGLHDLDLGHQEYLVGEHFGSLTSLAA